MQDASGNLYDRKTKRLNKGHGKTMKRNRKRWGGWRTSITGETLLPTQPPMGALCSGGDGWGVFLLLSSHLSVAKGHQNGLCLEQLDPLPSDLAAWPIAPQHRTR